MKIIVKHLYVNTQLTQNSSIKDFHLFNIIENNKGKLLFVQKNKPGVFDIITSITEEHVECIQDKINFVDVDYTLFMPEIFTKFKKTHANYRLELVSHSIAKILIGESFGTISSTDLMGMFLSSHEISIYPGIGEGEDRVNAAISAALESQDISNFYNYEMCLSIEYPKEKYYTIDEHLSLMLNLKNITGNRSTIRYSKQINNFLGEGLGISLIMASNSLNVA